MYVLFRHIVALFVVEGIGFVWWLVAASKRCRAWKQQIRAETTRVDTEAIIKGADIWALKYWPPKSKVSSHLLGNSTPLASATWGGALDPGCECTAFTSPKIREKDLKKSNSTNNIDQSCDHWSQTDNFELNINMAFRSHFLSIRCYQLLINFFTSIFCWFDCFAKNGSSWCIIRHIESFEKPWTHKTHFAGSGALPRLPFIDTKE